VTFEFSSAASCCHIQREGAHPQNWARTAAEPRVRAGAGPDPHPLAPVEGSRRMVPHFDRASTSRAWRRRRTRRRRCRGAAASRCLGRRRSAAPPRARPSNASPCPSRTGEATRAPQPVKSKSRQASPAGPGSLCRAGTPKKRRGPGGRRNGPRVAPKAKDRHSSASAAQRRPRRRRRQRGAARASK